MFAINKNAYALLKVAFMLIVLSLTFINPLHVSALFEPKKIDAYELIVDGETWFFLDDIQQISRALNQFKSKMTPSANENIEIIKADFAQTVEIVPVKVIQSKLNIIDNLILKLNYPLLEQNNYVVQEGDNAWVIAEKLNIKLEEIEHLNPDVDLEKLWPNDELVVSSITYYLDVNVTIQSKVEEVIHYESKSINDANLAKDTVKVTKAGIDGLKEIVYEYKLINGVEQSSSIISEIVVIKPSMAEIIIGSKPVTIRSTGEDFGVTSGRVSSDFGWRKHPITGSRTFHDGIDIANKVGTPINAYRDGTVTKVGWTDSYGNYIIIDHGGGLESYYIHLSGFEVSNGDSVTAGQLIGQMGKTGSATGSHLQFEIRLNGTPQNPWDYL